MQECLVRLSGLTVSFDDVPVLHGIDLAINRGDALGLVGESGSGKSVTWLAALGLLPAKAKVAGAALLDGVNMLTMPVQARAALRGKRIAYISQDPSSALNPVLSIGRQIGEALMLHKGLRGEAQKQGVLALLERVGIPDAPRRLNAFPHEFSGGQNQRIMIAMALAGEPDLLVADEPTTALDVTIQAQILDLLNDIRRDMNMALVLISHDLGIISETCDRVAVMYAGRVVEEAPASQLFSRPRHPYSAGLIGSLPVMDGPRRPLVSIGGTVPDPKAMPSGCAFAPRCHAATAACTRMVPADVAVSPQHRVACIHLDNSPVPARELAEVA